MICEATNNNRFCNNPGRYKVLLNGKPTSHCYCASCARVAEAKVLADVRAGKRPPDTSVQVVDRTAVYV